MTALAELKEFRPSLYFQFDGFDSETYRIIRGEPDILAEKLLALDRLAAIGLVVTLVPAIERGVNQHEIGRIIDFAIKHPAVRGINFQPAFHAAAGHKTLSVSAHYTHLNLKHTRSVVDRISSAATQKSLKPSKQPLRKKDHLPLSGLYVT
jgi:uncharacterized radical SAM superfamily Fe-S cluster-containing enzyme